MVLLCAFQLFNVHLLLLSGIGTPYDPKTNEGVIGRNYSYQVTSSVTGYFPGKNFNPFVASGAIGMCIDDFNGDNFDHGGLGFVGGGYMGAVMTNGRPIQSLSRAAPPGTPAGVPRGRRRWPTTIFRPTNSPSHAANYSFRDNYLDLDPTYTDAFGRKLLRMTFDFHDNDHTMSAYLTDRLADIVQRMGPAKIRKSPRQGTYSVVPYQTTHTIGGAIMGTDPATSALNIYQQSWDVSNLFVLGASGFPQNAGYNPTGTVAAVAYWAAEAIVGQYVKNPGPLVKP